PRVLLVSSSAVDVAAINQKVWALDQVRNPQISSQVMQGFSCTRVETFTGARVKSLIKGCRRKGSKKVSLVQTQLTCMYNFIKNDNDIITYSDYPPELLLYYEYVINCQSYFTELGAADFSVLSSAYASRIQDLISNARGCLNITGVNLSATSVGILGNLACVLDGSYIPNSDESILQNLKNCNGFTSKQIAAMETLLLSGTTRYGNPSTWNQNTLNNLSPLPLYLTNNFWKNIAMVSDLCGRDTSSLCTVGNITQVEVSDDAFPFSYDPSQFDACLSVPALKDNLAAISDKTNDPAYQQIIMQKLNQAYPAGISDDILMVLGPVSRAATTNDISNWNVTRIDTLSALMKSYDGSWTPDQAILSKYVNASGNALGSLELNAIGGPNLCALLTGTVQTITSGSIL
uniref:Mesothelin-like protein n=1 Tax=Denticeps clupeoides TaxID=299321 RepID=A0AAY4B5Q4_9TELE